MKHMGIARKWYETGTPPQEVFELRQANPKLGDIGAFWERTKNSRDEHEKQAQAYASERTGYSWNPANLFSDEAEKWGVIRDCEYDRLEAAAKERRIMMIAATLQEEVS